MTNSACKIRSLSASWWMQLVVEFNRRYSLTQAGRRVVNPRVRTRGWVGYGYDPGQKIGEWVHGFIPMTHPPLHG